MRDYLLSTIQKTFEVGIDQAERLYQELLECTRNKNLVIDLLFDLRLFDEFGTNANTTLSIHKRLPFTGFRKNLKAKYKNWIRQF